MVNIKFGKGLQLILCAAFALVVSSGVKAQTLFYSGDTNNTGRTNQFGTFNEQTFEKFVVGNPLGWKLSTLFSNDFQFNNPADPVGNATWSIRTGMTGGDNTAGNPGFAGNTLFTGTTAASRTPNGHTDSGFAEYTVAVDISTLGIILAPGTYWLEVTPLGNNNRWYNATTSGTNKVNAVNGGNGISHVGSNYIARGADFSMGITGQAVTPEGSSLAMFALGGLPLAVGLRRKFRKKA